MRVISPQNKVFKVTSGPHRLMLSYLEITAFTTLSEAQHETAIHFPDPHKNRLSVTTPLSAIYT